MSKKIVSAAPAKKSAPKKLAPTTKKVAEKKVADKKEPAANEEPSAHTKNATGGKFIFNGSFPIRIK